MNNPTNIDPSKFFTLEYHLMIWVGSIIFGVPISFLFWLINRTESYWVFAPKVILLAIVFRFIADFIIWVVSGLARSIKNLRR